MDNKIKHRPENFRDKEIKVETMRNALFLIAKEIQRFRVQDAEEANLHKNTSKNYVQFDLYKQTENTYLSMIKIKNKKLQKLKQNLSTACGVSRIILSSKDKEMKRLTQQLNRIRNESSNLSKDKIKNLTTIEQLRTENLNITNKVLLLSELIHLGYERLQQTRNELSDDNISVIIKLNMILEACEEYYRDFSNVYTRCEQLEQRTKFLNNKINILENNLGVSAEEIRNLKIQNLRFRSQCDLKGRNGEAVKKNLVSLNKIRAGIHDRSRNDEDETDTVIISHVLTPKNTKYNEEQKTLYISYHSEVIRSLILDQDLMLKELEELCEEVRIPE